MFLSSIKWSVAAFFKIWRLIIISLELGFRTDIYPQSMLGHINFALNTDYYRRHRILTSFIATPYFIPYLQATWKNDGRILVCGSVRCFVGQPQTRQFSLRTNFFLSFSIEFHVHADNLCAFASQINFGLISF